MCVIMGCYLQYVGWDVEGIGSKCEVSVSGSIRKCIQKI